MARKANADRRIEVDDDRFFQLTDTLVQGLDSKQCVHLLHGFPLSWFRALSTFDTDEVPPDAYFLLEARAVGVTG